MSRSLLIIFIMLGCASDAMAMEPTSNKVKLDNKLESNFVKALPWQSDFNKVREKAKKENKPIFAYFTRSYSP